MKMQDLRKHVILENQRVLKEEADEIHSFQTNTTRRAMELAQGKGALSWLISLPIEQYGYFLHRGAFHDAVELRYGWCAEGMLSICACRKANDI